MKELKANDMVVFRYDEKSDSIVDKNGGLVYSCMSTVTTFEPETLEEYCVRKGLTMVPPDQVKTQKDEKDNTVEPYRDTTLEEAKIYTSEDKPNLVLNLLRKNLSVKEIIELRAADLI